MEEDMRGAELGIHSDHLNQKTYGFQGTARRAEPLCPNLSLRPIRPPCTRLDLGLVLVFRFITIFWVPSRVLGLPRFMHATLIRTSLLSSKPNQVVTILF